MVVKRTFRPVANFGDQIPTCLQGQEFLEYLKIKLTVIEIPFLKLSKIFFIQIGITLQISITQPFMFPICM